jgi:hypothetical protein
MMTETPSTAIGSSIPLLFTYRDCLFGNGFVVEVKANFGRALCVHESDGFWMYGVNPGAMAAFGDDPDAAHAAFRQTFSNILKELALEANSFEEFRALVDKFFADTNPGYERDWFRAVDAVRRNEVDAEGLPRVPADSPRTIEVSMKKIFNAADNAANLQLARAA